MCVLHSKELVLGISEIYLHPGVSQEETVLLLGKERIAQHIFIEGDTSNQGRGY